MWPDAWPAWHERACAAGFWPQDRFWYERFGGAALAAGKGSFREARIFRVSRASPHHGQRRSGRGFDPIPD